MVEYPGFKLEEGDRPGKLALAAELNL